MGRRRRSGKQKGLPAQPTPTTPRSGLNVLRGLDLSPAPPMRTPVSPVRSEWDRSTNQLDDFASSSNSLRRTQPRGQYDTPTRHHGDASTLLSGGRLAAVRGQVQAVAISLCLLVLIHLNSVLWADYIGLMLWAFVLSEAMPINRMSMSWKTLHGYLKQHSNADVVWWVLGVAGAEHTATQWRRAIAHEKQTRKGGAPQGRIRTWRVLNTCARKQLSGWKNAYSPRRSRWRCFQVFHYIWQVCNWPVDLLFHLLEAALDNALASLSLFLVLHLYPPIFTIIRIACATMLAVVVVLALLSFRFTRRRIATPIVGAIASREILSIAMILGSIVCVVFCVTFLVSSALHDLADGTRSLYNYIIDNTYTEDKTGADTLPKRVEDFITKLGEYAEDGYVSAQNSYAEEEWWPVVAGVRSSLKQGDDGIKLVGDAMDDLRAIYNDTEWWPVADFGFSMLVNTNATHLGKNSTLTWGAFRESAGGIVGDWQAFDWRSFATSTLSVIEQIIDTPTEIARSVLALGVVGLGWSMWLLVAVSEWGVWSAMFVYFLFKMTSMRTDVLRVVVGYVVPSDTEKTKDVFTRNLRNSFSGVFFLPFNISFVNAGLMLLVLDVLELVSVTQTEGKYLLSLATLLVSLTQILGGYVCGIVALPWAIGRIWLADYAPVDGVSSYTSLVEYQAVQSHNFRKNESMFLRLLFESIMLEFVLFYGCASIRYSRIQREHELGHITANPWVLDFALVIGVTKFGLQGMLLGPFLVAIGGTVWDALVIAQCEEAEEHGTSITASLYESRSRANQRQELSAGKKDL